MGSVFDGLPEPMSGQSADFLGVSARKLDDARKRREESPKETGSLCTRLGLSISTATRR